MTEISASVLNTDFNKWKHWLKELEEAGVERIHFDIMDNKFVPNNGIGEEHIQELRGKTKIFFETHLMAFDCEKYFKKISEYGNELAIFHIEAVRNPEKIIKEIRDFGMMAGIAVNNRTSAAIVLPFLRKVDLALVMSVEAGFGGQKFDPQSLDKIAMIRKQIRKEKLNCKIEVDGGINPGAAKKCIEAGADVLAAGTSIFNNPKGIKKAVEELRENQ